MSENEVQPESNDNDDRAAAAFDKFSAAVDKLETVADTMAKSLDKPIVAPDGTVASPTVMNAVKDELDNTTLRSIESLLQRLVDRAEETQ